MIFYLLLIFAIVIILYHVLILKPAKQLAEIQTNEAEFHAIQTEDGITLSLYRYKTKDFVDNRKLRNLPLIMCHGMGVNHHHLDDANELSLAIYYQKAGFDVWLVDLRGCGNSTKSVIWRQDKRFDFDHYVNYDVPCIIKYVCEQTGAPKVHWLGHSMGGMVLYGYAAKFDISKIASATLLASAIDFSEWTIPQNRIFWWIFYYIFKFLPGIYHRTISRFLFPIIPPIAKFFQHPKSLMKIVYFENMSKIQSWKFLYNALADLPKGLVLQTIRWVAEGNMSDCTSTISYTSGAEKLTCPSLIVASSGDLTIPLSSIKAGYELAPEGDKTFYYLEPSVQEATMFGHADMIYSSACFTEFFPLIRNWLIERDQTVDIENLTS